jgi:hypothetical protein
MSNAKRRGKVVTDIFDARDASGKVIFVTPSKWAQQR